MARDVRVAILGDASDYQRAVGVADRATMDLDNSSKRVGDTVDKNRSVVANFAGNAIQDVPGVTGAFGALNVAAGQFAEYATEGDINMRGMVGQIGGMVAIGFAVQKIAGHMQKVAEARAFNRDQVDDFVEGMREGATAAEAMAEAFEDAGKVEIHVAQGGGDITRALDAIGLSLEDFTALAELSEDQIQEWGAAQRDAGADADAVAIAIVGATQTHQNLATAEERAAVNARFFGEATGETEEAVDDNTEAIRDSEQAIQDWEDATRDALGLTRDLEVAHADARDAIQDYTDAVGDSESTEDDLIRARDRAMDSFEDVGQAAYDAAFATEVAAGRRSTAEQTAASAQIWELGRVAGTLDPDSDLRRRLDEYIAQLGRIPTHLNTDITVSGNAAGPLRGARAHGGPVSAGSAYIVGEEGAELFVPNQSGQIIPNGTPMYAAGGGDQTIHVHLNLDGREIDNALVRLKRRDGRLGFQ